LQQREEACDPKPNQLAHYCAECMLTKKKERSIRQEPSFYGISTNVALPPTSHLRPFSHISISLLPDPSNPTAHIKDRSQNEKGKQRMKFGQFLSGLDPSSQTTSLSAAILDVLYSKQPE